MKQDNVDKEIESNLLFKLITEADMYDPLDTIILSETIVGSDESAESLENTGDQNSKNNKKGDDKNSKI